MDDLALIAGLIWLYRRKLRDLATRGAEEPGESGEREEQEAREGADGGPSAGATADASSDPYAVLGVPRSASQEEIRAAYRARMREYHPDKVAHLGEDLQELAHRKTLEIQRAFEKLRACSRARCRESDRRGGT